VVKIALKISSKDVVRGAIGAIIAYTLYNLNQPILEMLLLSELSITWIAFFLGLYNICATSGIIIVNKILGSITPEMAQEARQTGEEVNVIANRMSGEEIVVAKKNLKEYGSVIAMEEAKEKALKSEPEPEPAPVIAPEPEPQPITEA